MGIDEIVDGYEVVTNAELVPEEIFAHENEQHQEDVNTPGEIERHSSPHHADIGQETAKRETGQLPAKEGARNHRRSAAVLIEDGVEEHHIDESSGQQRLDDQTRAAAVLPFVETEIDHMQRQRKKQSHAKIGHKADAEGTEKTAEGERRIGRRHCPENKAQQGAEDEVPFQKLHPDEEDGVAKVNG